MNGKAKTLQAAVFGLGMIFALGGGTHAAGDEAEDDAPPPPDIAEESASRDDGEQRAPPAPRVQTRQEHGQTITEYSRGGRVFLMTVKPRVGPTQYWDDPDGDGQFQNRTSSDIDEDMNLPKWRLGGW